jgi:hypothetical protein
MTSVRRRIGRLSWLTLAAVILAALFAGSASGAFEFSGVGVRDFATDGSVSRQAGAHADFEFSFSLPVTETIRGGVVHTLPTESVKDVALALPAGMYANPHAFVACSAQSLFNPGEVSAKCPVASQIGVATFTIAKGALNEGTHRVALFNISHGPEVPAKFGFHFSAATVTITASVRPGDYGVSSASLNTSQAVPIQAARIHLWGVPADPRHDAERARFEEYEATPSPPNSTDAPLVPFFTNPGYCPESPSLFTASGDSWENPTTLDTRVLTGDEDQTPFVWEGCESLGFEPTLLAEPTSRETSSPTGLTVDFTVPQNEAPDGLASANVRRAAVTLPQGMTVSPSSANGLGACSEAQVGIGDNLAPTCPESSKIGSVQIRTPLLEEELEGGLYLARQHENPFGSLLATYLIVEGPGFYLKLPGKVTADSQTGQLTVSFDETPQLPFEELRINLKTGPRAPLAMPTSCGTYAIKTEVTPWSGTAPVKGETTFQVNQNCSTGGFSPGFKAGTANPTGGSFSPFTLEVTRNDGETNLSKINATLPPGVLAKLAGVPLCGDAQASSGNCPAGSQVGTTTVGAGPGSNPIYVPEAGKAATAVYLAGPYRGAPYSLVVKVPAQAGPFDLGTVVVRNALKINPVTTQVSAESDPLPQILEGIPISYRDVRVEINRPEFTVNLTNCSQFQVTSLLTSSSGQTASPKAPFAAANCERLGFKPTLGLQMKGSTKRAGNPALTATLKAPAGQANIANTTVILPKTVFIDQRHVSNPCTRVQYNANACPAKSVLGTAVAYSPLLDKPLEGLVYFRSNGGERQLPDLVADLNGQIHIELVGFIDSKKVGKETSLVRTRFASVPDAPVSKFVLKLKGGKRSLIQNSANLCKVQPKAEVKMTGQNGKTNDFEQKIAVACGKAKKKSKQPKKS